MLVRSGRLLSRKIRIPLVTGLLQRQLIGQLSLFDGQLLSSSYRYYSLKDDSEIIKPDPYVFEDLEIEELDDNSTSKWPHLITSQGDKIIDPIADEKKQKLENLIRNNSKDIDLDEIYKCLSDWADSMKLEIEKLEVEDKDFTNISNPKGLYTIDFHSYLALRQKVSIKDFVILYEKLIASGCIMEHLSTKDIESILFSNKKSTLAQEHVFITGTSPKGNSIDEIFASLSQSANRLSKSRKVYLNYQAPPNLLQAIMRYYIIKDFFGTDYTARIYYEYHLRSIHNDPREKSNRLLSEAYFEVYSEDIFSKYGEINSNSNILTIRDSILNTYNEKNDGVPLEFKDDFFDLLTVKLWDSKLVEDDYSKETPLMFLAFLYSYYPQSTSIIGSLGLTSFILSDGKTVNTKTTTDERQRIQDLKTKYLSHPVSYDQFKISSKILHILYESVLMTPKYIEHENIISLLNIVQNNQYLKSASSYKPKIFEKFMKYSIRNYSKDKRIFEDVKDKLSESMSPKELNTLVGKAFYSILNDNIDTTYTRKVFRNKMLFDRKAVKTPKPLSTEIIEFLFEQNHFELSRGSYADVILNIAEFGQMSPYPLYGHYGRTYGKASPANINFKKEERPVLPVPLYKISKRLKWYNRAPPLWYDPKWCLPVLSLNKSTTGTTGTTGTFSVNRNFSDTIMDRIEEELNSDELIDNHYANEKISENEENEKRKQQEGGNIENNTDIILVRDNFLQHCNTLRKSKEVIYRHDFYDVVSEKLLALFLKEDYSASSKSLMILTYIHLYYRNYISIIDSLGLTSLILNEGKEIHTDVSEEEQRKIEELRQKYLYSLKTENTPIYGMSAKIIPFLYDSIFDEFQDLSKDQVLKLFNLMISHPVFDKYERFRVRAIERFLKYSIRNYLKDSDTFNELISEVEKLLPERKLATLMTRVYYNILNEDIDTTYLRIDLRDQPFLDQTPARFSKPLSVEVVQFLFENDSYFSLTPGAYVDMILNAIEYEHIDPYLIYAHYTRTYNFAYDNRNYRSQPIVGDMITGLVESFNWYVPAWFVPDALLSVKESMDFDEDRDEKETFESED